MEIPELILKAEKINFPILFFYDFFLPYVNVLDESTNQTRSCHLNTTQSSDGVAWLCIWWTVLINQQTKKLYFNRENHIWFDYSCNGAMYEVELFLEEYFCTVYLDYFNIFLDAHG